jgi:hypothetical protein
MRSSLRRTIGSIGPLVDASGDMPGYDRESRGIRREAASIVSQFEGHLSGRIGHKLTFARGRKTQGTCIRRHLLQDVPFPGTHFILEYCELLWFVDDFYDG